MGNSDKPHHRPVAAELACRRVLHRLPSSDPAGPPSCRLSVPSSPCRKREPRTPASWGSPRLCPCPRCPDVPRGPRRRRRRVRSGGARRAGGRPASSAFTGLPMDSPAPKKPAILSMNDADGWSGHIVVGCVPLTNVLGVDHRVDFGQTVAVDHFDVVASAVGQLARDPADVDRDDIRRPIDPVRFVPLGRRLHEAGPDWDRQLAGVAIGNRSRRLIEPDPDTGNEVRREADEPCVHVVVGRAGLARRGQREAGLPRPGRGAGVDDVGEHARHQERGGFADRAVRCSRSV